MFRKTWKNQLYQFTCSENGFFGQSDFYDTTGSYETKFKTIPDNSEIKG